MTPRTFRIVLRASLALSGLFAYRLGGLVAPLYRARPDLLRGEPSLLVPPGMGAALLGSFACLSLLFVVEIALRRRAGVTWAEAAAASVFTSTPLLASNLFYLALIPGAPVVSDALAWLVIDGRPWLATLVGLTLLYLKRELVPRPLPAPPRWVFALGVAAVVLALTPSRRFSQPYDERWGTGDEPRYVRITASLLHDADADIGNAEEHVGRKVDALRFLSGAFAWVPSIVSTAREALVPDVETSAAREPRYLGGPVIEGRDGGLYYAFLPGFPLLLAPSMALDSYVDGGHLYVTLLTCLGLGVALVVLLSRLVGPLTRTPGEAYGLSAVLGSTLPVYFYHYQLYTEVTAAILVTLVLIVLCGSKLTSRRMVLFAIVAAYLPWLHGKYLPIWGVAMAAFAWKAWREHVDPRSLAKALVVPCLGLGLNCLFVFHITGSLMPDALWVLHGYERSGMLVSGTTLPGLHYLFLGRVEGLFVYAPHLVLAVPGLWALRRRDPFAFYVGLGLVVPYVLAAASHDQGGAGAWSPPGRYLVPVIPVVAMALAAWLDTRLRWAAFLALAAGSFWIGQGMLAELNYPYDRPAFLGSLVLDPSPVLESAWVFPAMLLLGLGVVETARRLELRPAVLIAILPLCVVLLGSFVSLRVTSPPRRAIRLRGSPVALELVCDPLRLRSVDVATTVHVEGHGLSRRLVVPAGVPAEIDISVDPVVRLSRAGRAEHRVVTLGVEPGAAPVDVDARCR